MKNRPNNLKHLRKLYFTELKANKEPPSYLTLALGIGIGIFIAVIIAGIIDYLARMGKL